jgi:hypothetical protein
MFDGVNKLWIVRTPGGTLDLSGYPDELSAIDALLRELMVRDSTDEAKERVREVVEFALLHMEDPHDEEDPDANEVLP